MSNYYDLYCLPCADGCGLSVNHGDAQLNALVPAFPAIQAFYDAEPEGFWEWEVACGLHYPLRAAAHWWALHRAHHIVLRDEYGHMAELTPPAPREPSAPVRYCPGCGWPGGKHAPSCPDMPGGEQ